MNRVYTDEQINIFSTMYKNGDSTVKIGELFKINPSVINGVLKRNNVAIRSNDINSRKYQINDSYFENIDTPEKAYFLGLIFSDGNLFKNTISISLKEDDGYILKYYNYLFQKKPISIILNTSEIMKNRKTQHKLTITNKNICSDFKRHGLISDKSLNIEPPKNIHPTLLRYFILGYFDGNGCIYVKNTNPKVCLFNIAGSLSMIKFIQDKLIESTQLTHTKITPYKNIFYLRYSGRGNIKQIFEYLYGDVNIPYLTRKYDKFRLTIDI